ncbi:MULTISPECIES: prepilin-type N-terminal cleavage/methylation domain-containing protein [unclassified Microcoleus]|uniref:prepilin-type N-terminal cleavage/methylation domain-containing protein n=1 Tax=unclassified Microcoleus TaxID=2642155 RepID=UPI002FD18BEB
MKTPILLKVLQISATKANPNYKNTPSRKGDQGFTLLEVLAIALIVGILSSIAAPSWEAFINRQRVRTVNDRVLQTLRSAQSEAKRTKRDITVTFNPTNPPTLTINPTDPATNPPLQTALTTTPPIQTVTFDAGGEIKPGMITLLTNAPSITFNYQGNITSPSIQSRTPRQINDGFTVTVAPARGGGKQCVIVETILGGMRTDEGTFNASTGQGCP